MPGGSGEERIGGHRRRQPHRDDGTMAEAAADANGASVLAHDLLADPQPEPGADVLLGGEEGLEDPLQVTALDADARVRHGDAQERAPVSRTGADDPDV